MGARLIRLRYNATCIVCSGRLAAGERGWWYQDTKLVRCEQCGSEATPPASATNEPPDGPRPDAVGVERIIGTAGASARAQHERRREGDERRVLTRHPRLGRLILAFSDEPQSTKAWEQGAAGEERVGALLNQLTAIGASILHDRRIPGSQANIDHIVVAPSGVWVIDAKRYTGQVSRRDVGSLFRTDMRLYVSGRDRTKLVTGMAKQVTAVRDAVNDTSIAIRPVLCFTEAEWTLFAKPFEVDGVLVVWPKALLKTVTNAPSASVDVARLATQLAEGLRAAAS